jgi:hypothetical protein
MTKTIRAGLLRLFFITVVLAASGAQESGPQAPADTSIEVPDLLLRVEELELQEVDAVLPQPGSLALGQVDVPLPGAGDLEIDQSAFVVRPPGVAGTSVAGPTVFSSGRLGAGSSNYILGELELFRLGSDPRFRMRFRHESLDGYAFSAPGSGFFAYENLIDGSIEAGDDERLALAVDGSFRERVDGLQGQSDFYSVGTRSTTLNAGLRFLPDPLVLIEPGLEARLTTRIQSASGSAAVPTEREIVIAPSADATVSVGGVDLVLEVDYDARFLADGEIPAHQLVEAQTGTDFTVSGLVDVEARAGVGWEPGTPLLYPWSLSLAGVFGAVDARLAGGYRIGRTTLGELWADMPTLAAGDSDGTADLLYNPQWYADSSLSWFGEGALSGGLEVSFVSEAAGVEIGTYDSVSDEFSFVQEARNTLSVDANAAWQFTRFVALEGSWTGRFIDIANGTPTGEVGAGLRAIDASERLRANLDASVKFYPEFLMPTVDFVSSFAPSDELEFVLEVRDMLAPVLEEGRPAFGAAVSSDYPFIEPGFRAAISARISL